MNKKTALTLWIGVTALVIIGLVATVIHLNIAIQKRENEYEEVKTNLEQASEAVIRANEEQEEVINKAKEKEKELNDILQEQERRYNELYEKYLEEISPVSFNSQNLLSSSQATERKLNLALKGTGLEGLEESYIQAEKEYGVNAIFLVSLTAEESAWGTSSRAMYQNNMSGFEVYSDDAVGAYFDSKHESIITTAKLLKNHYLTPGGEHFNGYDIYSVNIKYSASLGTWANNISTIANQIVSKINSQL